MVSNRRLVVTNGPDFYPTPAWGTQALLKHIKFNGMILEPCCGDGAMAEILKETGLPVIAFDIVDRGYGKIQDFLEYNKQPWHDISNIITNPPFNVAEDLLRHALNLATEKVCFLLRTAFLESIGRYNRFYKNEPPSKILVFSERLSMYPKGYDVKGGGTTSYAWFVWDKQNSSKTTQIEWIAPGLKPRAKQSFQTELTLV